MATPDPFCGVRLLEVDHEWDRQRDRFKVGARCCHSR